MDIERFRNAYSKLTEAINKGKVSISEEMKPGMYIDGIRVADVTKVEMTPFMGDVKPVKYMTLESAIALAANAHRGQKDLGGEPYILHPLRLMSKFKTYEARMTAILHDVVEDTDWTIEALARANVPFVVVGAVDALTRKKQIGEVYMDYIHRVIGNYYATAVKIEDLKDNLDMNRLLSIRDSVKYFSLFERERKALDYCLQNFRYNGVL